MAKYCNVFTVVCQIKKAASLAIQEASLKLTVKALKENCDEEMNKENLEKKINELN